MGNYDKILEQCKIVLSSDAIDFEYKKFLLWLRREYIKIQNNNDFKVYERNLYGDKNLVEKFLFEMDRIDSFLEKNPNVKRCKIEKELCLVVQFLRMRDKVRNRDDVDFLILENILKMEFNLRMDIGLFEELCEVFEKEVIFDMNYVQKSADCIDCNLDDLKKKLVKG